MKKIKCVNLVPSRPLHPNLVCHFIVKCYHGDIYNNNNNNQVIETGYNVKRAGIFHLILVIHSA